jgi:hypothetical protein
MSEQSQNNYGGLLGKIAFTVDMSAAGHSPEEIELKWVEHSYGYGSDEYIHLRLAQQMGASEEFARDALWSFRACCCSEGHTLH